MSKIKNIPAVLALLWLSFAGAAHAISVTKKIQGDTARSASDGGAFTGTYVATGYCDTLRIAVTGAANNNATPATLYVDVAPSSTSTVYHRSSSLGSVGGVSTFYLVTASTGANAPYSRLYLDYSAGFTGSTAIWCTYEDGSR